MDTYDDLTTEDYRSAMIGYRCDAVLAGLAGHPLTQAKHRLAADILSRTVKTRQEKESQSGLPQA
jgi:hypothetical protein